MKPPAALALFTIAGWCLSGTVCQSGRYLGREVGALSQLQHGVRGRLFAVDSRTLFLKDFHYDGEGPTAYFYVGTSKSPGPSGAFRLRDERGSTAPLKRYRGESITLSLPDGKTLKDVRWFSVWCDEYAVNFGDVSIPRELEYPRPARVGALRGVHGVSSDPVVVVDAQTLLIPHFSYDGEAPDAKFWVGRGDKPSPQGIRIPDENGKESPLRRYDKKTIVLTLPGELTVFDIGHFAVWCEAFTVNFGHIALPPAQLANVPPSLKMLGVSPQSRNKALVAASTSAKSSPTTRKPIANLDATTYRPSHLRPGAGPLALVEHTADLSALHRRADDYSPPSEQRLSKHNEKQHTKQYQNPQQKEPVHQQQYHQQQYHQQEDGQIYNQNFQQPLHPEEELIYQQQFDPQYSVIPIQQNQQVYQRIPQNLEPSVIPYEIQNQNQSPLLKRISYYQQQVQENEKLRQQSELLRQQSEHLKNQLAEAFRQADETTQQRDASQRGQRVKVAQHQQQPETDSSYQFQQSISPVEPQSYEEDLVTDRYRQFEPAPNQYRLLAQSRGLRAAKSGADDLDLVGESGSQ